MKKGFTLIEILIAALVLSVGLMAIAKLQFQLLYYSILNKQQAEALIVGEKKMEELRNYEVLTTTVGKTAYADIVTASTTSSGNNTTYTLSWTVTTTTTPAYKVIDLTVSWTDPHNNSQQVALSSRVGRLDPDASGETIN